MRSLSRPVLVIALMLGFLPASQAAGPVKVEMVEFAFRPAVIRVRAGQMITVNLVNRGQIAHQFQTEALRGLAVTVTDVQMHLETSSLEILRLQPGAFAAVWFTPRRKGRFRFACTIEGHREAGMEGILEVY